MGDMCDVNLFPPFSSFNGVMYVHVMSQAGEQGLWSQRATRDTPRHCFSSEKTGCHPEKEKGPRVTREGVFYG